MEVFAYLCFGLFALAGSLVAMWRARALQPVHHELGRMDIRWSSTTEGVLTYDGVPIDVHATYHEHHLQSLRFVWPLLRGTTLELRPESLARQLSAGDLLLTDRRFDEEVYLQATDDAVALAILDPTARSRIRKAIGVGAEFHGDQWHLSASEVDDDGLDKVLKAVTRAHKAMRVPTTPDALVEGLEARATGDTVVGMRRQALEVLVRRGLARDGVLSWCENDLQPSVRLVAAAARGEPGRPCLEKLLATGSRTWKLEAALALLELGGHAEALAALVAALDDAELVERAAEGLARHGSALLLPELGAVHARAPHPAIASAIAALRPSSHSAAAGALALADEGGELSMASGGDGRLSEPADH